MEYTQEELYAEYCRRAWPALQQRDYRLYIGEVERAILESFTRKQAELWAAMHGSDRYLALCAARRAGKTGFLARAIMLLLLRATHKDQITYVAESLQTAKRLIWRDLDLLIRTYALDRVWTIRENTGEIFTREGAQCVLRGLNKIKQSNVGRGLKSLLFAVDECQDYEHLLDPLLLAVGPSLMDSAGYFVACGTPGYAPQGTWYDWCHGAKGGFLCPPAWTIRENEAFPRDPEEALREERERNGWTEEHPDYQREHLGLWVHDPTQFVCEFHGVDNVVTELPEHYGPRWKHVIGIDFGWNDACAWTVVAVDPYGPDRIVLHAELHARVDNDQAAEITARLVQRFATKYVVCDPAGGGKTFFEGHFNARYGRRMGVTIQAANKQGKLESVRVINTDFRASNPASGTRRLRLYLPTEDSDISAEPLARELRVLRWADRERAEVLTTDKIRDDAFDSFRYAMVEVGPWKPREKTDADVRREQEADAKRAFEEACQRGDEHALAKRERMREQERAVKAARGWGYRR